MLFVRKCAYSGKPSKAGQASQDNRAGFFLPISLIPTILGNVPIILLFLKNLSSERTNSGILTWTAEMGNSAFVSTILNCPPKFGHGSHQCFFFFFVLKSLTESMKAKSASGSSPHEERH